MCSPLEAVPVTEHEQSSFVRQIDLVCGLEAAFLEHADGPLVPDVRFGDDALRLGVLELEADHRPHQRGPYPPSRYSRGPMSKADP